MYKYFWDDHLFNKVLIEVTANQVDYMLVWVNCTCAARERERERKLPLDASREEFKTAENIYYVIGQYPIIWTSLYLFPRPITCVVVNRYNGWA